MQTPVYLSFVWIKSADGGWVKNEGAKSSKIIGIVSLKKERKRRLVCVCSSFQVIKHISGFYTDVFEPNIIDTKKPHFPNTYLLHLGMSHGTNKYNSTQYTLHTGHSLVRECH